MRHDSRDKKITTSTHTVVLPHHSRVLSRPLPPGSHQYMAVKKSPSQQPPLHVFQAAPIPPTPAAAVHSRRTHRAVALVRHTCAAPTLSSSSSHFLLRLRAARIVQAMQPAAIVSQAPHIRRLSTPRKVRGGSWCPRQRAREDAAAHPTGAELADALYARIGTRTKIAFTAVLPKIPHSNCCKRVPNRPLRGRRGRFRTLLQLFVFECGIFGRTAVDGRVPNQDDGFPAAPTSLSTPVFLAAILPHPPPRLHPTSLTPLLPVHYLHL